MHTQDDSHVPRLSDPYLSLLTEPQLAQQQGGRRDAMPRYSHEHSHAELETAITARRARGNGKAYLHTGLFQNLLRGCLLQRLTHLNKSRDR